MNLVSLNKKSLPSELILKFGKIMSVLGISATRTNWDSQCNFYISPTSFLFTCKYRIVAIL